MSRYNHHSCDKCGLTWSELGKSHSRCPSCSLSLIEKAIEEVDELTEFKMELALIKIHGILYSYDHESDLDNVRHWHEAASVDNPCCDLETGVPNKEVIAENKKKMVSIMEKIRNRTKDDVD